MNDLTHASWFSGVGGLDMGLERAGWRTVSFSEIDPYASAVLAQRWPDVPNLGDILDLSRDGAGGGLGGDGDRGGTADLGNGRSEVDGAGRSDRAWQYATLWTGGFPCQDLSVAGKRRGMGAGTRSGLAFAFLDLAAVHRPRFILLENVPGLLSSHGGRDMAALVGALVELGYGVGYRVLDARYFGVPQRRRRVFILGVSPGGRAGAECAAEVLSVGSRCRRHPPTGVEAGPGVAAGAGVGAGEPEYLRQSVNAKWSKGYSGPAGDEHHNPTISASPDPGGVRAADGLAGRLDDRPGVDHARPLLTNAKGGQRTTDLNIPLVTAFVKAGRAQTSSDSESWRDGDVMPTLNAFDVGDVRVMPTLNAFDVGDVRTTAAILGGDVNDDPLLPLGLDSHRYRCCGNGVVSDVAEWIGRRLAALAAPED